MATKVSLLGTKSNEELVEDYKEEVIAPAIVLCGEKYY